MIFSARIVKGSGRGRALGSPTVNLDDAAIPAALEEGVYAVRVMLGTDHTWHPAAMHYGPRPTFGDSRSCEVHLLEGAGGWELGTGELTVEVVQRLRDVREFADVEELKRQIADDIARAQEILRLPPTSYPFDKLRAGKL